MLKFISPSYVTYRRFVYCLLVFARMITYASEVAAQDTAGIKVFKAYYDNGRLKSISHQGSLNGCGVAIGTDSIFNLNGKLTKTVSYKHEVKDNGSCMDIITFSEVVSYYPNGNRRLLEHYRQGYEGEPKPFGRWLWYNERGAVVREKLQKK